MKKLLPGFLLMSLIPFTSWAQQPDIPQPLYSAHIFMPGESPSSLLLLYDNDGGISGVNSIPTFQCNTSLTPSVVIQNFGSNTLTTAVLQYNIDGSAPQFIEWQGELAPFFSDTILLPELNVAPGTHTLNVQVTEANGETDENELNDYSVQFNIVGTSEEAPYHENFAAPCLPDGYFVENKNSGPSWMITEINSQQNNSSCIMMPFYFNDSDGDEDFLYMKNLNLTNLSSVFLGFDVAYAYYSEFYFDELRIDASINCGGSWEMLYDKAKNELATAPFTDVPFTPEGSQWRREWVDLSPYAGFDNVLIRFDAISGHGNNLYIDNISVDENTSVDDVSGRDNRWVLCPNPANESVQLNITDPSYHESVRLYDYIGRLVMSMSAEGKSSFSIPLKSTPAGTYVLKLMDRDHVISCEKLLVVH